MYSRSNFKKSPAVLLALLLLSLSSLGSTQIRALAQSTAEETAEPACPASTNSDTIAAPTLNLVWQTGGTSDDMITGMAVSDNMFPSGWITVDSEGNAFVPINVAGDTLIKEFDSDGNFVMSFKSSVSYSTGIAVDTQGNIYLNDFTNAQVLKYDGSGKFLIQWATEAPTGPSGIVVDPQGNIIVDNHRKHDHYVQRFDSSGQLLAEWGSTGKGEGQFNAGGSTGPDGLAVDENGNVYVTDPQNYRIQIFDPDGNFLTAVSTKGSPGQAKFMSPFGLSVDGERNIYTVGQNVIQKFDKDGQFLAQWNATEGELNSFGYYLAMAVDTQGDIYWLAHGEVYVTAVQHNMTLMVLKKFRQC